MRAALSSFIVLMIFAPLAAAKTPYEACNLRFSKARYCVEDQCGKRPVLPAEEFCTSACMGGDADADALCLVFYHGARDSHGMPAATCAPNPRFEAAKTKETDWLACKEQVWTACDGEFVDQYSSATDTTDIVRCQADVRAEAD